MSIWDRAKAKVDELVGRAEEVYGESHGDAAAQLHGEAHRLEGEAEEDAALRQEAAEADRRDDGTSRAH
ncbi:CsbD family protein [Geodermatophilus sp. DF01-2]|uniref:CsbD family protein n=1 Tax=Geodermatophilus sp. DF01-2 TaxID=2559610 RepID=UPI0010739C6F|nr:CsbD family protein [Geodermatophilus sp. DF01_2]TFV62746.1 CsbD family protein [Geodermatophilus sp. DF01_2]